MSAMAAVFLALAATTAPAVASPPAARQAEASPPAAEQPPAVTSSAPTESAMTHDGKYGIRAGVKLGAVIPTSKLGSTFGIGLDGEYRLPWLERQLGVGIELGYAAPSL